VDRIDGVVVFAGAGDTAKRLAAAGQAIAARNPRCLFLTGAELAGVQIELEAGTDVIRDVAASTVESCLNVACAIADRFAAPARLLVVTSNYHAPRARWLLRGLLGGGCVVATLTSADVSLKGMVRSARQRNLIRGEILSWLYGLPLGLLARLLPRRAAIALYEHVSALIREGILNRRQRR